MVPATLNTALSGALAQSTRLSGVASNLANQSSVGALPGPGGAIPAGQPAAYQPVNTSTTSQGAAGGVRAVTNLVNPAAVAVSDPSSPYANAQGMVASPNVDASRETVNMIDARRAYSTNLAVLRTQDKMAREALNLTA